MNYDHTTETIKHVSLCSGYEGIGLGLRRVLPNLREIAYVEREGFAAANLVAKMEAGELDAAPVFTDVKTFPYGKFRGCVDILSGGLPCQPFSAAGKHEGVEDPRHLFPYIANGIRECQPGIVFLENVEGIISSKTKDGESVLQYVLGELEGLDYRATAGIFSAREVGATHQRKRVFILAMADPNGTRDSGSRNELGVACEDGQRGKDSAEDCFSGEKELADSDSSGGIKDRESTELRAEWSVESLIHRWPSRPRETQKEWEEPRVIQDSSTQVEGQSKSRLGRTTNGSSGQVDATANRLDRLRLLGNGVVPATAAKAFVTLLKRLNS